MPVAEELVALLGFKLQGQGDLAKWKKGLDEGEVQGKRVGGGLARLGTYAGLAGTAMAGMAVKGVQNFAAFERQMSRIGVTAGASVQETVAAGREVQDLANKFSMPLDEARQGLDTLVSSGMNLRDAMTFLPSVLMTAQAAGAATDDIANTAQKTSSALGIQADQMQKAFDIMVTGGKAGQFELKDMAQHVPTLASQFSTLGYKGETGLKSLIAVLQTLRTRTGTAGEAATQASNIFAKMFSEQTEKNFKDFGINLRKEMEAAKKSGTDALTAFVALSEKALKGDMTKLPKLFQDLQLQQGMTTLIQAKSEWKGFIEEVNSSKVDGSTLADFQRIAGDTTASIQKMSNSWDQMLKTVGAAVAPSASGTMDAITSGIEKSKAADEARKRRGDSMLYRSFAPLWENPDDILKHDREARHRSSTAFLAQPAAGASSVPPILQARRLPSPSERVAGAFDATPPLRAASATPGASGSWGDAKQAVAGLDGKTVQATATLDISQFLNPAELAKKAAESLGIDVTAKADIDISSILSKVDIAKQKIMELKTMSSGASGSWGTSTPARVAGAGAAP